MIRTVATRTTIYSKCILPACSLTCKRQYASDEGIQAQKNELQKEKPIAKKVEKIKRYWLFRYVDYIANFDKTLEKTFPKMMHVYRLISCGTKNLYIDLKKYIAIKKKETLHGSDGLSREELQLNHTMPRDVAKITPVLLILAIPFTNYVLFPMAYFFPRKILTSHYWTPEQKDEFVAIDHKQRRKYIERVFTSLELKGKQIVKSEVKQNWINIVTILRNKRDPSVTQVLACKPLFEDGPFSLKNINRSHMRELLLTHGMSKWTFYIQKALIERSILIQRMDVAIMKEGGASKMTPSALKIALSFRGIDPTGMSTQGLELWLDKWLQVSSEVDIKSISLLLHCPVLLAYNWNTC